ncbi:DUF4652 domain-containing protein [Paenisporosarcina quisquiliarum]|uniref:DUF4652 domain-containing protein n=1 Tax=Paenisporosarcina quisquiliarum TaxID=365346 RepID=A0A9X3LGJ2_9BACL|nr:DUF4652 domain-containing protein [Paenisporosarcina quisquiliarum]MCZ8535959.1 DUF4652 domain-containing protein [Paenisporosarcina quisquiliarum]
MNDIKQQLITKIGDTSERSARVQQQVNLKKNQQPEGKKIHWGYYATIAAITGVLALGMNLLPSVLNENPGQLNEPEPQEIVSPNEEDSESVVLEKGEYYELLKQYFFPQESEVDFIGGFENGGLNIQTLWLNDFYVQQVLTNDGGITKHIYRINGDQIELVYDEMIDGTAPSQISIDELNKLFPIQIVIKAPFNLGDQYGDWTLIDTSGEVTTYYESFSNVLILENSYDDSRIRKYFVKDYGMVKWESAELNKDSGEYEVFITTEQITVYSPPEQTPSHFKATIMPNYVADFHSGWKISPDNSLRATINGKGETAGEEGEAVLVIENLATSETTIYALKDNYFGQFTPKKIEWIDENRLFVIIGASHGMVTVGGKLYELNISDNVVTPVIEDLGVREEIMSVKVNNDGTFTYEKHVYDTDQMEYNDSHVEEGTMPIPPAK